MRVADDIRRALSSDLEPEEHRQRLDDGVVTLWRFVLVIVALLMTGAFFELMGLL